MNTLIYARWCRERGACYTDRRLARLFDRPMTLLEVLTRRDGRWKRVPAQDRLWVFFRAAPAPLQMSVANRAADRQVRARCLHCDIDAVERRAARWLSGEDRSRAATWRATEAVQGACRVRPEPARRSLWSAAFATTWAARWVEARWADRAATCAAAAASKESEAAQTAEYLAQLADAIEALAGKAVKEQP